MSNFKVSKWVALAALSSMALPVAVAVWEISNEPFIRPDERIDNGAERGAAIFLSYLVWPSIIVAAGYYWGLVSFALHKKPHQIRALLVGAAASCAVLSLVVSAFFYQFELVEQLRILAALLLVSAVAAVPGVAVLGYGLAKA